ncbi:hypothetical protein J6590_002711 [Homalodisca vitripennis]|nr:hypothetical protein J6590_002711 [Homalodisca vitripennis]
MGVAVYTAADTHGKKDPIEDERSQDHFELYFKYEEELITEEKIVVECYVQVREDRRVCGATVPHNIHDK